MRKFLEVKRLDGKLVVEMPTPEDMPAAVERVKDDVKSGWKTTEFWRTLLIEGIGFLAVLGVFTPEQASGANAVVAQVAGLVTMILPNIGYTQSRGNAKKKKVKVSNRYM